MDMFWVQKKQASILATAQQSTYAGPNYSAKLANHNPQFPNAWCKSTSGNFFLYRPNHSPFQQITPTFSPLGFCQSSSQFENYWQATY